ncbi:MAG: ABC transporter permease [Herpetosiphonaceae bacterium]|nr:ABC transporter permease [Herpetosiphonaceae bacterium]
MNKTISIARTEFLKHLQKPTFWLTLLGVPILLVVVSLLGNAGDPGSSQAIPGLATPDQIAAEIKAGKPQVGFVDQSGLVPGIPASFPAETAALYRQYASIDEAQAALANEEIPGFYIIPADYLTKGELVRYSPQFNPFGGALQESLIEIVIATNLLDSQDVLYARALLEPTAGLKVEALNPPVNSAEVQNESVRQEAAFALGTGFALLLYISIFMSASLLLQALIEEKENRVIEVVLSSVSPRHLLQGKIAGLGLLGLFQVSVWLAIAGGALVGGSKIMATLSAIKVTPLVWALALVCFILGYLIYASLMAGIGAIANTMRESSQLTVIVVLPIIIPLMFLSVIITQPNGTLSQVLTYVPLTAPIVLVMRAAISAIPLWQVGVSLLGMVATVILLQILAARIFKANTLLSGAKPSLGGFVRALRG